MRPLCGVSRGPFVTIINTPPRGPLAVRGAAGWEPDWSGTSPFTPGVVETFDLRHLASIMRRRLRLFAGVALSVVAAAVGFTLLTPPSYTATAQVMLDQTPVKVLNVDTAAAAPVDSSAADTQVEVLKSPQLAHEVVDSLHLDRDPEFTRGLADARSLTPAARRERVVNAVRKELRISRSGLTQVIDIDFRSNQPQKAAAIANKFAQLYLSDQVGEKSHARRQAADWLAGQLNLLRDQLTADETAVQQFKIAHNLLSAQGATLTEQEVSAYNESLAQAKAQVAEDVARLHTARAQLAHGSSGDDVGEALSSPTIERLRQQRAEASRKVASLASDFKDSYPDLRRARNELADIDSQIQSEIGRIISNLAAKAQVSQTRAAAIAGTVGSTQGQLAANDRASVQLSQLNRNAEASRDLYESYLARYKEISSQIGLAQPDGRLVSQASPPTTPSSPNTVLNLLLGAALAIGAGLGAVGLAEMLEAGLTTSADVEKHLNLRYLGAIPLHSRGRSAPIDLITEQPFSSFSEAFRTLAASILHGAGDRQIRTIMVTSALPDEGKTTTAIGLARTMALQGYSVAILDCDLRRRSLQRILTSTPEVGLLEVLSGAAALDEALLKDLLTDVDILPLSNAPTSTKDVFGSKAMERLLGQLKTRYDVVILDSAPVLPVADSRVLARATDFVAVVAVWRRTPYKAIDGALRLLAENGAQVGGLALNQVDMRKQVKQGYGDLTYYFNRYSHYYLESA